MCFSHQLLSWVSQLGFAWICYLTKLNTGLRQSQSLYVNLEQHLRPASGGLWEWPQMAIRGWRRMWEPGNERWEEEGGRKLQEPSELPINCPKRLLPGWFSVKCSAESEGKCSISLVPLINGSVHCLLYLKRRSRNLPFPPLLVDSNAPRHFEGNI